MTDSPGAELGALAQRPRRPKQPQRKIIRRVVDGVLLLDKPIGMSSNGALQTARRLLNAAKAGHTGTLDPMASGLLPLTFGEATKFSQMLLDADKTYEAVVQLGVETDSGDAEGAVIATRPVAVGQGDLEIVLARFRGEIEQVPPMYSALKRDGKALYEYAREGIVLERAARPVTIHALSLVDYQAPFLKILVTCSKGTYVRVLGEDIGAALGCGAHLNALRRIEVGALDTTGMITLDDLLAHPDPLSLLRPVDALLSTFPALELSAGLAKRFLQGQRLALGKEEIAVPAQQGRVRIYHDGRLLGTGQLGEYAILAPERLISTAAPA